MMACLSASYAEVVVLVMIIINIFFSRMLFCSNCVTNVREKKLSISTMSGNLLVEL